MQVQEETNKNNNSHNDDPLFDRKVDLVTAGLWAYYARCLKNEREVSRNNALTICNYIMSMKTEINLSDNYRNKGEEDVPAVVDLFRMRYEQLKPGSQPTK